VSDEDWFESGSDGKSGERPDSAGGGGDDWFEGDDDGKSDEPSVDAGVGGDPAMEDFEDAFDSGAGEEPSMGDFEAAFGADTEGDSGGGSDFDEEFESDIPRLDLGVRGLDEMIQGGIPERSLMVVMGSAGTGKTTFGLQFLNQGLNEGENAVYITLEETNEAIRQAAVEMGWPFDEYIEEGRLAVVDLDPIEMANSLTSIRSDLPRLIEAFGADRLVLDSVSLLEMMYNEPAKRRTEVFNFTKSLKQAGVTTMVTSEASDTDAYTSKHGIIEYLTDAVFVLQYVRSEFQETRMAVEIQKIRNANHSRETKPYEITGDGISVYRQANIF
jgi:KaiC domain protein